MKYNQELRVKVYFFNDTATTEIYTLSLHDALPIFDIDSDNRLDTKVEELYLGFRNYFDSSTSARYGVLSDKQTIIINAGVLTNLAQNLQSSILGDLQTIRHIIEKCQAKNDAIKASFEERKKRVSENIKALLATNGLTDTFNSLQSSLERLVEIGRASCRE